MLSYHIPDGNPEAIPAKLYHHQMTNPLSVPYQCSTLLQHDSVQCGHRHSYYFEQTYRFFNGHGYFHFHGLSVGNNDFKGTHDEVLLCSKQKHYNIPQYLLFKLYYFSQTDYLCTVLRFHVRGVASALTSIDNSKYNPSLNHRLQIHLDEPLTALMPRDHRRIGRVKCEATEL